MDDRHVTWVRPAALLAAMVLLVAGTPASAQTLALTPLPATPANWLAAPIAQSGNPAPARFVRDRDSVWNGLLIGAAAGALYGFAVAPSQFCDLPDAECATIVRVAIGLPSIAGGAAIGGVIDYFARRDTPGPGARWRKVRVAPFAGKGVRGVQARVSF